MHILSHSIFRQVSFLVYTGTHWKVWKEMELREEHNQSGSAVRRSWESFYRITRETGTLGPIQEISSYISYCSSFRLVLWIPFHVSFQLDCEAKMPPLSFTPPHPPSLHIFFPRRFFHLDTWLTWIFKYEEEWLVSLRTLGCILSCPIDLHSVSSGDSKPLLTAGGTLLLQIPPEHSGTWEMESLTARQWRPR